MDFANLDSITKSRLAALVEDCFNSYGDQSYPHDATERAHASNVQKALSELGHEVSLSDAAGVWGAYSLALQAGWLSGAETVLSAKEILVMFCQDDSWHGYWSVP